VVYRLVWGMEAARVYEAAQGNDNADALLGTAVTPIETGTFNRAASILIRSGFDHRLAAISAATSTSATFDSTDGTRQWIDELDSTYALCEHWPTPERFRRWSRESELDLLGEATVRLDRERQGVLRARRQGSDTGIRLLYRGPGDIFPGMPSSSSVDAWDSL
jgi:hypothetical protein